MVLKTRLAELKVTFEDYRVSYFLDIENCKVVPKSTKEEGLAIQENIKTLKEKNQDDAMQHYKKAVDDMNAGRWSDSIGESIHMVESVARKITGKRYLSEALQCFSGLHPALKQGWNNLYGYTSDEKGGIRHAKIGDDSNIDEALAIYMFSSCISFAAYLARQTLSKEQNA